VQWKGHLPAGKTYDKPVISLDIAPTALALAGVTPQPEWKLDGTNLLPFLTGEDAAAPHDTLFWRFRFPPANPGLYRWAMRQGDWKLVKNGKDSLSLYSLDSDIGETKDRSAEQPERVAAMTSAYKQWDAHNMEPRWGAEPPAVPKPESAILRR
jgi:arylsulfatase A-like enzyme